MRYWRLTLLVLVVMLMIEPSPARGFTRTDVDAYRTAQGLAPVPEVTVPGVVKLAQQMAADPSTRYSPKRYFYADSCGCRKYGYFNPEQVGVPAGSAYALYAARRSSVSVQASSDHYVRALLLDPAISAISVVDSPTVSILVVIAAKDPPSTWLAVPPRVRAGASLGILFRGSGPVRVSTDTSGGLRHEFEINPGDAGTDQLPTGVHVAFGPQNPYADKPLAYGVNGRVEVAGLTASFAVAKVSAEQRRRSFRFTKKVALGERRTFRSAVRASRPQYRAVLDVLDRNVLVTAHRSPRTTSFARYNPSTGRYVISMSHDHFRLPAAQRDQVILHELAHIVDFNAITPAARADIARFRQRESAAYCRNQPKNRFGHRPWGRCMPVQEWFADNTARWARRDQTRALGIPYYQTAPPTSWSGFSEALRRWLHPRPYRWDPAIYG